jgi:hypothetical protein
LQVVRLWYTDTVTGIQKEWEYGNIN